MQKQDRGRTFLYCLQMIHCPDTFQFRKYGHKVDYERGFGKILRKKLFSTGSNVSRGECCITDPHYQTCIL
jgi:hypothetical protein